jgi:hypothetical protein
MQVLQEAADLDEDDESIQDNLAAVTFLVMADA